MRALGIAQVKAQLSALLHAVGIGEDVEVTRLAAGFDLGAFLADTTNQPMHQGSSFSTLREEARY